LDKPGSHTGSYPVFAPNLSSADQLSAHPIRRRLHDRYVMNRFPALSEPRQDLRDTDKIIRYARELFDDEQPRRAIELLRIAIEEDQSQRALWLALIELCFLARDATRFTELILTFAAEFAHDSELPTLSAMRRDLMPHDPAMANAPRLLELPNWSVPADSTKNELLQKQFHVRLQHVTIARVNQ
jgi:hypothetical protein